MTHTILRIDASARKTDSVSRGLSDRIVARFNDAKVITRDLANPLQLLDQDWVGANFTPADDRSPEQNVKLKLSDQLIDELRAADTIVIGVPIYNFGVPAALKSWIDLISRVGETFQYTETGPVGLLEGKRAIIAVASGGTPVGSDMDFASGYLRHLLGFIGISDVTFIAADQLAIDAETTMNAAHKAIEDLELAA